MFEIWFLLSPAKYNILQGGRPKWVGVSIDKVCALNTIHNVLKLNVYENNAGKSKIWELVSQYHT